MHGLNSKLASRLLAMWGTPPTPRGWIGQTGGQGDKAINICTHRKYYILQHNEIPSTVTINIMKYYNIM